MITECPGTQRSDRSPGGAVFMLCRQVRRLAAWRPARCIQLSKFVVVFVVHKVCQIIYG